MIYDELPDELLARVTVQDMGVVKHTDPETGEEFRTYDVGFFVVVDGVEHGLSISSSPYAMARGEIYDRVIENGTFGVLKKAGLI